MSEPLGDRGNEWILVCTSKTSKLCLKKQFEVLHIPYSCCQLWKASYGKGLTNCSARDTAFIINSTDWFLQKSFFNQEFPTPRMAFTLLSYLRGYLGT